MMKILKYDKTESNINIIKKLIPNFLDLVAFFVLFGKLTLK